MLPPTHPTGNDMYGYSEITYPVSEPITGIESAEALSISRTVDNEYYVLVRILDVHQVYVSDASGNLELCDIPEAIKCINMGGWGISNPDVLFRFVHPSAGQTYKVIRKDSQPVLGTNLTWCNPNDFKFRTASDDASKLYFRPRYRRVALPAVHELFQLMARLAAQLSEVVPTAHHKPDVLEPLYDHVVALRKALHDVDTQEIFGQRTATIPRHVLSSATAVADALKSRYEDEVDPPFWAAKQPSYHGNALHVQECVLALLKEAYAPTPE